MDSSVVLILVGFIVGAIGTLIGAGGGFILVPLLLLTRPDLHPEIITAISMAVVACNAASGSVAYVHSRRVDFKAGLLFSAFTIPGSIAGVYTTQYISRAVFNKVFGCLLIILAIYLIIKKGAASSGKTILQDKKRWIHQHLTDREGHTYTYSYDARKGALLSLIVGYLSPILGIGGGIIHVPAMVQWLYFPVHIATATSHFILAIMATVSVIVHYYNGNYNDPAVLHMIIMLSIGVIGGAQLGAFLSQRIKGPAIVKALAVTLGLVGLRILFFR